MKKIRGKVKQALSILLAVAMVVTCVPQTAISARAEEAGPVIEVTDIETEEPKTVVEEETNTSNNTEGSTDQTDIQTVMEEGDEPGDDDQAGQQETPQGGEEEQTAYPVKTEITKDDKDAETAAVAFEGSDYDADKKTIEKGKDLVFTVTPKTGYGVTKVEYKIGETTGDTELEAVSGKYTLESTKITGDVTIIVTTVAKKISITSADAAGTPADSYKIWTVTKEKDANIWTKGAEVKAASEDAVESLAGEDIYFIIEPADKYKISAKPIVKVKADNSADSDDYAYVSTTSNSNQRIDGETNTTTVYSISGGHWDSSVDAQKKGGVVIEVKTEIDQTTANIFKHARAAESEPYYKVTIGADEVPAKTAYYTAEASVSVKVTPDEGYEVVSVKKGEESVEDEKQDDGDFTFTSTFIPGSDGKQVTNEYSITVGPKEMEGEVCIVTFECSNDLELDVIYGTIGYGENEKDTFVEDVGDEESPYKYKIKAGAKYLEFYISLLDDQSVEPKVMIGDTEWTRVLREDEISAWRRCKIPVTLLPDDTIITISRNKTALTVKFDSLENIEDDGVYIMVGNNADHILPMSDPYEEDDLVKKWSIDAKSKVTLVVGAAEGCNIKNYKVGTKVTSVNQGSFKHIIASMIADTTINVTTESLIVAKFEEENGEPIDTVGGVYPVTYVESENVYTAYAVKGKTRVQLDRVTIKEGTKDCSSLVSLFPSNDSEAQVIISPKDAGKTLTLSLYKEGDSKPYATYRLKVKAAITAVKVDNKANGQLSAQAVDTEISHPITTTPANMTGDLEVAVEWEDGVSDEDKAKFEVEIKDGKLVITTPTAKAGDLDKLKELAAKATIKFIDKTKKTQSGNPADTVIKGADKFKLNIAAPALSVKPGVSLKFADDVKLILTLTPPAKMPAAPKEGKLWYEVTVAPQGAPTEADHIVGPKTYYYAVDSKAIDKVIQVSTADFGSGKAWTFDVKAKIVQTLNNTTDLSEAAEEEQNAALTGFASPTASLAVKTKEPYYADKLALKNKVSSVYTGQTDVRIATVDFGKNTTFAEVAGVVDDNDEDDIEVKVKGDEIFMSIASSAAAPDSDGSMANVVLGKHTFRVYATAPEGAYQAYADITVTVNRGIEKLSLTAPSDTIFKPAGKAATLKLTPFYNGTNAKGDNNDAKTKKVKDYVLVEVDEDGNVVKEDDTTDSILPASLETDKNRKVEVKNGTVTVNKGFVPEGGECKFRVRATAADYNDNTVVGYSEVITIKDTAVELGKVVIVRQEDDNYKAAVSDNGWKGTSSVLEDTFVKVLLPNVEGEGEREYTEDDFVPDKYLTFKSNNAAALQVNTATGKIEKVGKAANNIKIEVTTNDGGAKKAALEKLSIINATPKNLGLKVEHCDKYGSYSLSGDDYENRSREFTGTTDSELKLTVMRQEDDNWFEMNEFSDLKVTIKGAKVLNNKSSYNQDYTVIANTGKVDVTLEYTPNGAKKKVKETFAITNKGFHSAFKALKAAKIETLVAGEYQDEQIVTFKLELPAEYQANERSLVMIQTDAADRYNPKNTERYSALEAHSEHINEMETLWIKTEPSGKTTKTYGYFDLRFNLADEEDQAPRTNIPAGSYKLQLTCGTNLPTNGEFLPQTKTLTVTLQAKAPKSVKGSYSPASTVKMSTLDSAAGKKLAGTGKNFRNESYEELWNANFSGKINHFTEFFELEEGTNTLKLKSEGFSDALKAAVKAADKLKEEATDEDVIRYITASTSKEAKNDRVGYVWYTVEVMDGYDYKQVSRAAAKITVTFDNKKPTDTYTLSNATVLEGTEEACVNVFMNKKQEGVKIKDAYVVKSDNSGVFTVNDDAATDNSITLDIAEATSKVPKKYNVTLRIVPENNFYAGTIAERKTAWENVENKESDEAQAAWNQYVTAITTYGVEVKTAITIGKKADTGNKISVDKRYLTQSFTTEYIREEDVTIGREAGYDPEDSNYWITIPYTKNIPCDIGAIVSNDKKSSISDDNLIWLYAYEQEVRGCPVNFIDITLNKQELEKAVKAKKVSYGQTLDVAATVYFADRVVDDDNPDGYWDFGYDVKTKKYAYKTEIIKFKLTLPKQPKYPSIEVDSGKDPYHLAVKDVQDNKAVIEKAAIPRENDWGWIAEDLLYEAKNGQYVLGEPEEGEDEKARHSFDMVFGLIDRTEEIIRSYAPADTNTRIDMTQRVWDEDTDKTTITLAEADFEAPTPDKEGKLIVKVDLVDETRYGSEDEPEPTAATEETTKETTPVEITLAIPKLRRSPADVETALSNFVTAHSSDDYATGKGKALKDADEIARDAGVALGLIDADGKPLNTLTLYVDYNFGEYQPATESADGSISGVIGVYGRRYGGRTIEQQFTFGIAKLGTLNETKTNVENAVNALEVTNATTKEDILNAARSAIRNDQFDVEWKKAGKEDTLRDNDGDVFEKIAAKRPATDEDEVESGSIRGTLVIVDKEASEEDSPATVTFTLTMAALDPMSDVIAAIENACGIDLGEDNKYYLKQPKNMQKIVLDGGNKAATVKTALLKAVNDAAAQYGCTVSYAAKNGFTFTSVTYIKEGKISFTLVIADNLAGEGNGKPFTIGVKDLLIGPYGQLETLANAKADILAALRAASDKNTFTNATKASDIITVAESALNVDSGISVAHAQKNGGDDFTLKGSTSTAKGKITGKLVLKKTGESDVIFDYAVDVPVESNTPEKRLIKGYVR